MRTILILAAVVAAVPAQAETIRLTPEQAEAAIASGAGRSLADPAYLSDSILPDRGVHGEVGISIGTGGNRSVYGVAAMPLGETGQLVLGFDQSRGRGFRR